MTMSAAPHGTRKRYGQRCRCGPCREAARVYMWKYRNRRRAQGLPIEPLKAAHPRRSAGYVSPETASVLLVVMRVHQERSRVTVDNLVDETGRARSTLHAHLVKLRDHGLVEWDTDHKGTIRPTCAVVCHDEHPCEQSATLGAQELSEPGAAVTAPARGQPLRRGADMAGLYPGTPTHAQGRR